MNKRILGVVALLALAIVLMWTLRARTSAPSTVEPVPVQSSQQPVAGLTPSEPAPPARELAESPDAAQAAAQAPAESPFASIQVLVVNKVTRAPIKGIDITAWVDERSSSHNVKKTTSSRGKLFESLHTDEKGCVEIEVPANVETRVSVTGRSQHAGSDSATVSPLNAGDVHSITFELPSGNDMPFWVKLVDDPSEVPVAGASIGTGIREDSTSKSDEHGLALLQCRSWSLDMLEIQADGYARSRLKPEPGHAQPETALTVKLAKCATVRVHVVDPSDRAISNATVELTAEAYNGRGTTDAAGNTTISCAPAHVAIRAGITSPKSWNAPDRLVFEPGETRDIEWKLTDGCDVHGVVLDQTNAPVTKREMWMRKASRRMTVYFNTYSGDEMRQAVTDDQGRFRFAGVGAGAWWIGPSTPKDGTKAAADDVAAFAQVVEITEGQSDLDTTVHVDRGLFIRGQILDSKGGPTRGGSVNAYEQSSKLYVSATCSGRDNAFSLGPLMKGHYVLTARGRRGDSDSDPVEADTGAEDVVLRLRNGASISGTVFGLTGEPTPAKMWMTMRNSMTFDALGVSFDNKGAFQFEGLEAGAYDIAARISDGSTGLLESIVVETGEAKSGLSIRLAPGGHVRVRHEGPERNATIRVLSHGVVVDLDGVERSASREFAAPAGLVTVQATYHESEKRMAERTVDVKAGQTVDVVFEKDAH